MLLAQFVQVEIEVEDVDARLAEDAELALGDVLVNEFVDAVFANAAGFGNTRNLEECSVGSNVGIEAGAGGGYQIDGNRMAGIFLGELVDGALDAVDEGLV